MPLLLMPLLPRVFGNWHSQNRRPHPMSDDTELTPEDWDAVVNWRRGSQHPNTYYVQPPIKGRPPRVRSRCRMMWSTTSATATLVLPAVCSMECLALRR